MAVKRRYLKEVESEGSPTVSLEALFTTLVINAYEDIDVTMFDIRGGSLHE